MMVDEILLQEYGTGRLHGRFRFWALGWDGGGGGDKVVGVRV